MGGIIKLALACAAGFILVTGACVKTKIYDCQPSEAKTTTIRAASAK